ncbi:2Fe-2S iron-sulfur cluster-binding protein [Polaromonas sp.]|uniref:2Fe-2S iron-sulfur cluster-binding protein n=1 Tax=Polaromonas sp. TaxID=1869339 RepID=UPI0027304C8B|nr:2Fe-2S iron-sulfur cluster-binding protein [Polaromonas sp.]MDP1742642.1 2Fe-2S iron-sulfur cluster-binding protein [Polaromonas sp.]
MPAASNNDVFQVRVGAAGRPFDAPTSLPVLQSALAAGVWIESSCRNGTCRSCLCRLASGQVVYRMEWPGLSAEEKADGYILPCVAYPASDLVIQAPAQES